jgi:hypothetical protein
MSIYYRDGNQSPVAPKLDSNVDISNANLNQYVEVLTNQTRINNVPITSTPLESEQQKYTDVERSGVTSTALAVNFASNLAAGTLEGLGQPGKQLTTPDVLGVYNNNDNTRSFKVKQYTKQINEDPSEHEQIVNNTLLKTVGYNAANKFLAVQNQGEPVNQQDQKIKLGHLFYQYGSDGSGLGKYVSGSNVNSETTQAASLTIQQLSDIGVNIMFEAAQGQAGFDFVVSTTGSIAEAEARMLLPSEQRLGKRVSLGRFTPSYQLKKISGIEKQPNSAFIDNTDNIQTYGSFYNVYNQFDALVPAGQIALAVALILGFVVLLNSISGIASALSPREPSLFSDTAPNFTNLSVSEKRRTLGTATLKGQGVYPTSDVTAGNIISSVLGIEGIFSYTRHETGFCLSAGIQEFFGFAFGATTGTTAGAQAVNASFKILTESGRLNVVLREILRSGITLVENIASDPSQLASISGAGNLIRKLRDLKIVRFINVLLGIGDKVLFESDIHVAAKENQNSGGGYYGISGSVSYIDSLPVKRYTYIAKSRTPRGDLTYSNKNAGMVTLPLFLPDDNSRRSFVNPGNRVSEWAETLGIKGIPEGITDIDTNLASAPEAQMTSQEKQAANQNDRLPSTVVQKVETALEADYMPFYIHDLRTNEILAFHAFLEDASEDFQIEYTAQEGYGRMDKVQIYKGTTRTVSVNFKMLATNPADHNVMWYKLNKLATMIYPQWTQGRKVSVGDNINFIQPFSQIPGATPVIRLRLGDLYKSNYSKMAVARLFGITTLEDYNVRTRTTEERKAPVPQAPPVSQVSQKRRTLENLRSGKPFSAGIQQENTVNIIDSFIVDQNFYLIPGPSSRFILAGNNPIPSSTAQPEGRIILKYKNITTETVEGQEKTFINYEPVGYKPNLDEIVTIDLIDRAAPNVPKRISIDILNNSSYFDRNATANELERLINEEESTTPTAAGAVGAAAAAAEAPPTANSTNPIAMETLNPQQFYDESKNPILKAFKSSGGKGLAGVITSFKVDYGDSKGNWGLDGSRFLRAPLFVTVQLQMAVIHDITPGLDARGIMNAPIWPVGQASNYFVNNGPVANPTYANPGNNSTATYAPETDYFAVQRQALYINRRKG